MVNTAGLGRVQRSACPLERWLEYEGTYLLLKYSNESTSSLLLVLRADRRERRGRSLVAGALQLGEGRRRRRHQLGGDRLDVARRRRSHY